MGYENAVALTPPSTRGTGADLPDLNLLQLRRLKVAMPHFRRPLPASAAATWPLKRPRRGVRHAQLRGLLRFHAIVVCISIIPKV
jgi:hypothetical protein